ncbi:MAG: helix-turn-helix protein [Chitinophagaceae bacterium]|nr:helix-turn-helix protein [Chitinophagaceae bacterium]
MTEIDPQKIARNLKKLRDALDLSQDSLATLLGISESTVSNIETCKRDISLKTFGVLEAFFYMYSSDELGKTEIEIVENLREKMAEHFKEILPHYVNLLETTPSIVFAIKYKLLAGDYIKNFKEMNKITEFFKTLGWDFDGPSVHNALKRKPQWVEVRKHPTKRGTFEYRKIANQ